MRMTKPNLKSRFYPKNRAARVDRAAMTQEEWEAHLREKGRERSARWSARNPGRQYIYLRHKRASQPWWGPLLGAGDRCRKSGIEFTLTKEWAKQTYTGFCSLTGLPFIVRSAEDRLGGKSGGGTYSPSIDRINPLEGYTEENCRWILHSVNNFKGSMSDAEMFTIAQALLNKRDKPWL
jgi:hypothetical protein